MKNSDKLLPYIDMPIQHISENMLRLMRRGDTRDSLLRLYETINLKIPDIALRTTLILGHPGETDKDFEELHQFIKEIRFDRLGTFTYSDEDHTHAFSLPDKIPPKVAIERQAILMETQKEISLEKNQAYIGKELKVILDEFNIETHSFVGRTYRDAPEIDNDVIIQTNNKYGKQKPGDIVPVRIEDASEYELYGKFVV